MAGSSPGRDTDPAMLYVWVCSLCCQELPADALGDARKARHEEKHKRFGRNNITAGAVRWDLRERPGCGA